MAGTGPIAIAQTIERPIAAKLCPNAEFHGGSSAEITRPVRRRMSAGACLIASVQGALPRSQWFPGSLLKLPNRWSYFSTGPPFGFGRSAGLVPRPKSD